MPTISNIISEIHSLCDSTTTSYPAATILRRVNDAYERVIGWILEACGTWQWDDTNYSDLPIGTQTLIASQRTYTFDDRFLTIEEISVKDSNGIWQILTPIDQSEYSDYEPLEEAFKSDGLPKYYDKVSDDTIKLYPAPSASSCTLTSGLKIKFRRTADIFTSDEVTTGTKVPGFVSTFHYVLSYMASIPYCMSNKKDRVSLYEKRVDDIKGDIIEHYSRRERDVRKQMTMSRRVYK